MRRFLPVLALLACLAGCGDDDGGAGGARHGTLAVIAGRVDAVVSFWNAEGVTLRERGVLTREFRVDEYGAPRYPELVLAVTRETLDRRGALVDSMLAELERGTRAALRDPPRRPSRSSCAPRARTSRSCTRS